MNRHNTTFNIVFWCIVVGLCIACEPPAPANTSGLRVVTPVPTINETDPTALCNAVDTFWGRDWSNVIETLHTLEDQTITGCENFVVSDRLYTAYIGYGTRLEQQGLREEAISAYESALRYSFNDQEASQRLQFLQIATPTPPSACDQNRVETALQSVTAYTPTQGNFVDVQGTQFTLDSQPYPVHGVNYYPRDYPFDRFLTQMNVDDIALELELMQASGLNTLRIFIRHDDLFMCPGNGAIPIIENLNRLDAFIQRVAEYDYKLIIVLNTDADLSAFPLYDSPHHTMQQMQFIAQRYRDEPAIMAYDVRDRGDSDYTTFGQNNVLLWLAEAISLMRVYAPDHLITAGWDDYSEDTAPLVDFVSFHSFNGVDALRQEIAVLTSATQRPILLTAVGFNTYDMNELLQRQSYQRAFEAVARNNLSGWVVWTAFDYPLTALCDDLSVCDVANGPDNRFGLWNTSYFPKRGVDAVEIATGIITEEDLIGEN